MLIRDDLEWTGCDNCNELLDICRDKSMNVVFSDIRTLPFADNQFDNVISIAVLHHISTFEDRVKACQELVRVAKPSSKIFIQVWKDSGVKNKKFQPINDDGDYFVTWTKQETNIILKRFYHMFGAEEIDLLVSKLNNVKLEKKFIEAENWIFILVKI